MRCEEIGALLDQLLDGELSAEQQEALRAHADACHECADEIEAAFQMKALFGEMTPEADVPLAAQAAWRSAVKAEAKRGRSRRFTRWAGMAAAAVVVALGIGFALRMPNGPKLHSDATSAAVPESAAEVDMALEAELLPEAELAEEEEILTAGEAAETVQAKTAGEAAETVQAETTGEASEASRVEFAGEAAESAPSETKAEMAEPMTAEESIQKEPAENAVAGAALQSYDAGAGSASETAGEVAYEMADTAYLETDGAGEAESALIIEDYAAPIARFADSEDAEANGEEIAADDDEMEAEEVAADAEAGTPVHEVALKVMSIDADCIILCDLVNEYDGTADVQRVDGGANVYIEMPAENVAEFFTALAHLDMSGNGLETPDTEGEKISSLLLTLTE